MRNALGAVTADGLKRCTKCTQSKPTADFHKRHTSQDGWSARCKECLRPRKYKTLTCARCDVSWEHAGPGKLPRLCLECRTTHKFCDGCLKSKPQAAFGFASATGEVLRGRCRECKKKAPRSLTCRSCSITWPYSGAGAMVPKICPDCESTEKYCPSCDQVRSHAEFNANSKARTGLNDRCRSCALAYHNGRGNQLRRARDLMSKYGLTVKDWDDMLSRQGGKCACCKGDLGLKPAVDHCHTTGVVRGICCSNCNTGIGKLGDTPEGVRRGESYLWSSRDVLAELLSGMHLMSPKTFGVAV